MPGSSFADVLLVNPARVQPATPEEVAVVQSELGARLPSGYADYVQLLGDGALGHLVGVLVPPDLQPQTLAWRTRVQEYWFWDTSSAGTSAEALQQRGVLVGSSFDGDELCYDPDEPDVLYVLPRDDDVAHRVGPGLLAALDWMLAGNLNSWVEGWTFEVPVGRATRPHAFGPDAQLADSAARLEELGVHSHLVDLGHRRTYFLPSVGGRLSLFQFEGENLELDLSFDEDADTAEVERILAALG